MNAVRSTRLDLFARRVNKVVATRLDIFSRAGFGGTLIGSSNMSGVNDTRGVLAGANLYFVEGIVAPAAPAVPRPATGALMVSGFGTVGVASCRRRRAAPPDGAPT